MPRGRGTRAGVPGQGYQGRGTGVPRETPYTRAYGHTGVRARGIRGHGQAWARGARAGADTPGQTVPHRTPPPQQTTPPPPTKNPSQPTQKHRHVPLFFPPRWCRGCMFPVVDRKHANHRSIPLFILVSMPLTNNDSIVKLIEVCWFRSP